MFTVLSVVASKAGPSSAKGLLSFGAAILLIGAGVAVAAVGIAQMVKSFKELNPEQINRSCKSIGNISNNVYCFVSCCFQGWSSDVISPVLPLLSLEQG